MKKISKLLFVISILSSIVIAQESYKPLFRIYENGLYGYIDSTGQVIIPPKYKSAGEFSEGLAPVRENGYYGYIDESGKYVISPQYDYAEKFINGFAKINNNGNANVIDISGEKKILIKCPEVKELTDNRAKIRTITNKWGVIDLNGNLIIDTICDKISDVKQGIYIVNNYNGPYAAIDTSGNLIVPFGKYGYIAEFINGFAMVRWNTNINSEDMSTTSFGIIDRAGSLLFSKVNSPGFNIEGSVSKDSTFIASEYQYTLYNNRSVSWDKQLYSGIMDLQGNLVAEALEGYNLRFCNGNIYYVDSTDRYFLADRSGKITNKIIFVDSWDKESYYSLEEKKQTGKHGIIDTDLNYISEPFFDFSFRINENNQFIFGNYDDKTGASKYKLGISDINGNVILKPEYDDIDYSGFVNGIALVKKDGTTAYIDKSGKILWQKRKGTAEKITALDIDYQLSTSYNTRGYGWKAISSIIVNLERTDYKNNKLALILDDSETAVFNEEHKGISLYLINSTQKEVEAPSVDGSLYLVMQALDKDGIWKNIESYPSSFCGNSYVNTTIPAKYFFKYTAPVYEGEFKTKLRYSLTIIGKDKKITNIYSNEISGSINPAQFWRNVGWFNYVNLLEK